MAGASRRFAEALSQVDRTIQYSLEDALGLVKKLATAKFDETVEMAIGLGIDPKYSDQMVRGTCVLPHGTGRTVKVLVFARGEKAEEARAAGADHVGEDDLADRIMQGWIDFQVVIATPDMMKVVGKLGKVLGPRGLMPNPKTGTVTTEIGEAVRESKGGKITFRTDKQGNVNAPIGKASFDQKALEENAVMFLEKIMQLRPSGAKGRYLMSVSVSSTMGPGVHMDVNDVRAHLR
ncbi:MAG TPA: 50S ribosomal protein L1 [Candidatus Fermentibacter sp.]|nr:50S ribosomal protein L1 [Candidatus Fermentibacter sp.]HRY60555.1 50S ribosomal protein L1 [Candidatus Fermentibacter sp.]